MNGFLPLPRPAFKMEWFRKASPLTRNLWLNLHSRAAFKPWVTQQGESINPGQVVTSWPSLANDLAWMENNRWVVPHESAVRRAATYLREAGEITWQERRAATPRKAAQKATSQPNASAATGTAKGRGIVVTLVRRGFRAAEAGAATGCQTPPPFGTATPIEEVEDLPPTGGGGKPGAAGDVEHLDRKYREGLETIAEEKRRQREGVGESDD